MTQEHVQPSAGSVGGQHLFYRGHGNLRFVAESADCAHARVELSMSANPCEQRIVAPVVVAHTVSKTAVAGRATGALDPGVLIWRHRLGGELSS
jgi:hypothetical protein